MLSDPSMELPVPGDTRYHVMPYPQWGLEKPEKHRGSQRSSRHSREWGTQWVQPVPRTGGHPIMTAVTSPQKNGTEPPVATNNLHCLATTMATTSITPAPPRDNRQSTKAMGSRSEESPLSPSPYNPTGDPASITKKPLLPCTVRPLLEPSHGRWLGPGGPPTSTFPSLPALCKSRAAATEMTKEGACRVAGSSRSKARRQQRRQEGGRAVPWGRGTERTASAEAAPRSAPAPRPQQDWPSEAWPTSCGLGKPCKPPQRCPTVLGPESRARAGRPRGAAGVPPDQLSPPQPKGLTTKLCFQ